MFSFSYLDVFKIIFINLRVAHCILISSPPPPTPTSFCTFPTLCPQFFRPISNVGKVLYVSPSNGGALTHQRPSP